MASSSSSSSSTLRRRPPSSSSPSSSSPSSSSSSSSSSFAHLTPALVGFVPTLASVLFGGGDVLAEILIAAAGIYLIYKALKVPWETYDLYRSARRLAEGGPDAADVDRARVRSLKRWETLWLVLVCAAPSLAGAAIYGYRTAFPNYDRFLTNFNIALFVLSASARPLRHVFGAAREHALHVHAELVYPRAEVAELTARVAALEQHLGTLQSRTATHQELEDVQETVKPMLTQVLQAVQEMEDRTEQLTRQAEDRLGLVERSLGLVPVPDGSSAYARLQWALIGVGRGLVAAFVSPIVLPIQLAVTTWDVLASPFRGRASVRARTPPAAVRGPATNGHSQSHATHASTARGLDALKRTRSASHGVLTGLGTTDPL